MCVLPSWRAVWSGKSQVWPWLALSPSYCSFCVWEFQDLRCSSPGATDEDPLLPHPPALVFLWQQHQEALSHSDNQQGNTVMLMTGVGFQWLSTFKIQGGFHFLFYIFFSYFYVIFQISVSQSFISDVTPCEILYLYKCPINSTKHFRLKNRHKTLSSLTDLLNFVKSFGHKNHQLKVPSFWIIIKICF